MKLLLTRELGRLAKWLRILGFDTEYTKDTGTSSLIIRSLRDERLILTRNHRLLQNKGVKIVLLKSEELKGQLAEALKALNIKPDSAMMFTRCTLCNIELTPVAKEKIKDRVPEYVFETQETFLACPKCRRLYWQGTHLGHIKKIMDQIIR